MILNHQARVQTSYRLLIYLYSLMLERVEILGQLYKICSSILIADATRQGSKYTRTLKAVELNHACRMTSTVRLNTSMRNWQFGVTLSSLICVCSSVGRAIAF